jgi:hypothetical protein
MQISTSGSLVDRMIGAARLDSATYEAVEHDVNATSQAAIVVVLASLAGAIGSLGADHPGRGFIGGLIGGLIGWVAFAAAAYFVGTRFLPTTATEADLGQLLRVLGFAQVPSLITVLGFVPVLGALLGLIAFIWGILTTIVALRSALEMETGRAIATAIIAVIVEIIVIAIVGIILGVGLYGVGAL